MENLIYLHDPRSHPIRGRDLISPVPGHKSVELHGVCGGQKNALSSQRCTCPNPPHLLSIGKRDFADGTHDLGMEFILDCYLGGAIITRILLRGRM